MHDHVLQLHGNRQMPLFNNGTNHNTNTSSAFVQPMFSSSVTPEKENQPPKQISVSPVLPGTGSITHNVTRLLQDDVRRTPDVRIAPYSTAHFLAFRHNMLNKADVNKSQNSEDESMIDVENDSQEHLRSGDMPSFTDTSLSTHGSSSPHSTGSTTSTSPSGSTSPSSSGEPVTTTPESESKQCKKKVRTNYTNDQVQTLLKIFHENPYPDSEMMERIALDLGVPENKIKIWFQNKRARWRRRVNDNMTSFPHPFMPMSPMMSPVGPYGFMPTGPMMTSSPPQVMPGYFNYSAMQTPYSPTSTQTNSRVHSAYPEMTSSTQQFPVNQLQQTNMPASPFSSRSDSPQTSLLQQSHRHIAYPHFLYPQQHGQQ